MSTSRFHLFAAALAAHFAVLSKGELYRADIDGDDVWDAYLLAFPPGTDPMFRKRTEHDGSYDRNFVRQVGNLVRINADGSLTSIWDIPGLEHPYAHVAAVLSLLVKARAIRTLFRTKEAKFGYVRTFEKRDGQDPIEWHHFHADIPAHLRASSVGEVCGEFDTTCGVIRRGFAEIMPSAVDTVLDLIDQNALYRGAEFRTGVAGFKTSQEKFLSIADERQRSIVVARAVGTPGARIRNTAIGTLLQELTEGMELEKAVKRFEAMVAPANYKRPTALITQRMIDEALFDIRELGLESALQRRHAVLADVSINNVLWADNQAQAHMKDGLAALLQSAVKTQAPATDKAQEISIEDFQANVLPSAQALDLFLANGLQANLVSLTAPVHADAGQLFKWANGFAWSYNGNITDSIKEKVKAAGGNISATLRVSLAWFNYDDLDLHCRGPEGHIYYGAKAGTSGRFLDSRTILDVDMNAGVGRSRSPVENLAWAKPKDGEYLIQVNQFYQRETDNRGFTLEVENDGKLTQYSYPHGVSGTIDALRFTVKGEKITELAVLNNRLIGQGISQNVWGLATEGYVRVETVLNSPNHWDGERTGNKHWFFILEGCKNPDPARGIYNEFLKPELEKHRKVFEVLGNKTKVEPADQQLSGVGFSSTKRDSVILRVTGSNSTKLYKVNF